MKRIILFLSAGCLIFISACRKSEAVKTATKSESVSTTNQMFAVACQPFKWAKRLNAEQLGDISLDDNGNTYTSTYTFGDSGTTTYDDSQSEIDKFDPAGNLTWKVAIPNRETHKMMLDAQKNLYVLCDSSFSYAENLAVHVIKISPSGNVLWTRLLGISYPNFGFGDLISDIDIDSDGNTYALGLHYQNTYPNPQSYYFVQKISKDGVYLSKSSYKYTPYPSGDQNISFIKVLKDNSIVLTGYRYTNGASGAYIGVGHLSATGQLLWEHNYYATTGYGAFQTELDPNGNICILDFQTILKINPSGQLISKFQIAPNISSQAIAFDKAGNTYITGYFTGTQDFDPTAKISNLTAVQQDIFIEKYNNSGSYLGAVSFKGSLKTSNAVNGGYAIKTDGNGSVIFGGLCNEPLDFDPTAGINIPDGTGKVFCVKLGQCQ